MKLIYQTILVIILSGLILYQSAVQERTHRQVTHLSTTLQTQLDTLGSITQRYEQTHRQYEMLVEQLMQSHHRTRFINEELSRLSYGQQQDIASLQAELSLLLHSSQLQLPALPFHSIDSLLFQP